MTESINTEMPFHRRKDQKTDYEQRLDLVKSGKPRLVVRTSNRNTRVHVSSYSPEGDENEAQTISKELEEHGWEHNTGNIPAAYLTGFLAGSRAEHGEAILDLGLRKDKRGGRVFAAVQGARDAGLEVPAGEDAIPDESRMVGEHIEEMTGKNVPEDVEDVKENIEGAYQ